MAITLNPTAERIRQALVDSDGNVAEAARSLGLSRVYLHEIMRTYGIRIIRQVVVDVTPAGSTAEQ